jgi:hypothetical protein
MWDHVNTIRRHPKLAGEALAAVLGVDDERIKTVIQAPLGRALSAARLAREDVVRSQHERAAGTVRRAAWRQQAAVELLDGEPLEVNDVGGARRAAVAEHVWDVLGELGQAARACARRKAGGRVEELVALVSRRLRDRAVGEAARVQLDIRARRRQSAAESMVVGRRVGRWINDMDAHQQVVGRRNRSRLAPWKPAAH